MKQKFRKLSFVRVTEVAPWKDSTTSFDAIIDGTYSQLYGGNDVGSYSVYKVENGKIVNHISWFDEDQLSILPEQDRDMAEEMIESYNVNDECEEDEDD